MTLPTDWYECDSRFIPGHWQPAVLLDLALSRGIDSHRLLRGSGLFHEDILSGQARPDRDPRHRRRPGRRDGACVPRLNRSGARNRMG